MKKVKARGRSGGQGTHDKLPGEGKGKVNERT